MQNMRFKQKTQQAICKRFESKKIDYCLVALRTRYDYFGGLIYLDKANYKCVGKFKDLLINIQL